MNAPFAEAVLFAVIAGTAACGGGDAPATQKVSNIGYEAFYSPLNGAIMLRVGNAIAQVTGPEDLALRTRVAEQVAEGLRQ